MSVFPRPRATAPGSRGRAARRAPVASPALRAGSRLIVTGWRPSRPQLRHLIRCVDLATFVVGRGTFGRGSVLDSASPDLTSRRKRSLRHHACCASNLKGSQISRRRVGESDDSIPGRSSPQPVPGYSERAAAVFVSSLSRCRGSRKKERAAAESRVRGGHRPKTAQTLLRVRLGLTASRRNAMFLDDVHARLCKVTGCWAIVGNHFPKHH